jgi:N-acetylneuraminic acid mutarotase
VYQLSSGTWEKLPPLRHARAAGAAVVVGDQIVVVGGRGNDGLVPQTEIYDGQTWRDADSIPTPREHLTVAAHDGLVYAAGGREASPDTNVAVLERYDPEADQWKTMHDMPTPRGSIGGAVVEGRFVVVGGEASDRVLNVVEMYDFASDTWAPVSALLTPLHGPGVAAVGSELYVIGGAQSLGHTNSSDETEVLPFE